MLALTTALLVGVLAALVGVGVGALLARRFLPRQRRPSQRRVFGFFHPYCNAGGGGERVLWAAIRATLDVDKAVHCVVYSGDDVEKKEILAKALTSFNIKIAPEDVSFVLLKRRYLVQTSRYSVFTLLSQSFGSVLLCLDAISAFPPDVFLDTMGYAFTYPAVKLLLPHCQVVAYTHYPTISVDMLECVKNRIQAPNNDARIARSILLSFAKLLYYRMCALLYGFAGRFADIVMVNSTWTSNHINHIWKIPKKTFIVYPPCDTHLLSKLPIEETSTSTRQRWIVSVAQFRPEKNHTLQLQAFAALLKIYPQYTQGDQRSRVRLVLIGNSRGIEDETRIKNYRALSQSLGIADQVDFFINVTYDQLTKYLCSSLIGIHTMWSEHFGIGIVEYMASGLIPLANNSGGPKTDIIQPFNGQSTGFLATTQDEYVQLLHHILSMTTTEQIQLQKNARDSVINRFSDEEFTQQWTHLISTLKHSNTVQ